MSCRTTRTVEKTVYYIPQVDWPEFPELGEYEKIEDGRIATDEDYFRKLLTFKKIYESERNKYNEKKMKLEENENE
jgi:hypothetical protein